MKKRASLLSVAPAAAIVCAAFSARADQAADAWNAWNTAFLAHDNGNTYYSNNPVTEAPLDNVGGWSIALSIETAEDVYQRNHTSAQRQLVNDLMTTYLDTQGATSAKWCATTYNEYGGGWEDGWNDDNGWMITAVLHAYQITGNADFLTVAQQTWDCVYMRGWDTKYSGGGIWELMDNVAPTFSSTDGASKCALSNDPFIIWGVVLYQITGDQSYLTKAAAIYGWVHDQLFDSQTGAVANCLNFANSGDTTGTSSHDDWLYNEGTFIQSAEAMYRVTGTTAYYQDALLALNHRVSATAILACTNVGGCETNGNEWAYPIVKGLGQFTTFNGGLWKNYETWMQNNANAAWSERNALNITWNDWTAATPTPAPDASSNPLGPLNTRGAVGVWQFFPQALDPTLVGEFELENAASGLSLSTSTGDDGGIAVVQAPFDGSGESLWTFVPTNGGYYRIQNVSSGLLLTVASNSGAAGASIVALPVPSFAQGNEQWLPVANGDGTYSFYNMSSILALDDPSASTSAGTQFDQSFGNGTPGQSFRLISQMALSPDDAGTSGDGAPSWDDAGLTPEAGSLPVVSTSDAGSSGTLPDGSTSNGAAAGSAGGCGCQTAGTAPFRDFSGGFALLALGAIGAVRGRSRRSAKDRQKDLVMKHHRRSSSAAAGLAGTSQWRRSPFLSLASLASFVALAACSSTGAVSGASGQDASPEAPGGDASQPAGDDAAGASSGPEAGQESGEEDAGGSDATLASDAAEESAAPVDASSSPYMPCPATGACVIMPLGDSITAGYNSSTGGGYRIELLTRIRAAGFDATFVGDNSSGPTTLDGQPFPQGNEGFSGYTIDADPDAGRSGIAPLVPAALAKYSPDVVLLMIGTNDVGVDNDLPDLPTRLANLVDVILSEQPTSLLIVAQILPLGPPSDTTDNSRAQTYNTAIADLVDARAAAGKHIVRVDMYAAMTANPSYGTQWMNGLHPNDDGYVVVGDTWYAGLVPYL
jgi:MYXO-CTERM domain-containing protein